MLARPGKTCSLTLRAVGLQNLILRIELNCEIEFPKFFIMAMKEKRYKYVEDIIEDYLYLIEERAEHPLTIRKMKDKYASLKEEYGDKVLDKEEAEDFFKLFNQEKKVEERATEVDSELAEIEDLLKQFLRYLEGQQFTYERKDEVEKSKITHSFWLENGQIKSNRELAKSAKKNRELVS